MAGFMAAVRDRGHDKAVRGKAAQLGNFATDIRKGIGAALDKDDEWKLCSSVQRGLGDEETHGQVHTAAVEQTTPGTRRDKPLNVGLLRMRSMMFPP